MSWWWRRRLTSSWRMADSCASIPTVVQTDIHHPTDNTLLWDVVRVVTRLVGPPRRSAGDAGVIQGVSGIEHDRPRRRMLEIQRMTTRQRQERQTGTYRELIGIAEVGFCKSARHGAEEYPQDAWQRYDRRHGDRGKRARRSSTFVVWEARVIDQSRRPCAQRRASSKLPRKLYSIFRTP